MPELVAHDVRTLTGKDCSSRGRTMEELQALAVVKGVEVDPEIEIHRQYRTYFPRRSRQQRSPEIGAATQGFGGSPVAKIRGSWRMRFSLGSRGRIDNSDREGLLSQTGDRPLDDLASARLSTRAGIVLPSVDYALRLRPAFVGAARALPLRLILAADVFDARLDRFLAISSLPFAKRRHEIPSAKVELAVDWPSLSGPSGMLV